MALLPLTAWLLPPDFFDERPSICLSVLLLGQSCPACGLTRAGLRLLHGHWQMAYAINPLIFVLGPLLGYVWYVGAYALWKKGTKMCEP